MKTFWKLIQPENTKEKVVVLLAAALLYIALFHPLMVFARWAGAALIAVPVAAAGWLFGPAIGILAGLAGIGLNAALFFLLDGMQGVARLLAGWPGNLIVLGVGFGVGVIEKEIGKSARLPIELTSRERFFSTLGLAITNLLDPALELHERCFHLAHHLASLFTADYAYLLQWNASQGQMNLLTTTDPNRNHVTQFVLDENQADAHSIYIGQDQAVILRSERPPRRIQIFTVQDLSLDAHSELALPLVSGVYKFGVIVFCFDNARRLSSEQILFAQFASAQVSLALCAAEQDLQIKKHLQQANALLRIERTLSETEQVGLEALLQLIVNSAQELIPVAQKVVLHLVDTENQVLIPRAVASMGKIAKTKLNMRLGEGIAGRVIAAGKTISISDVRAAPHFIGSDLSANYRSLIVAPIKKNQSSVIGTISIDSEQENAFTPDDARLLEAFGVQAAVAIENARLLETARQDLQEMNVLYHISRRLAVTLEPDLLIRDITVLLHEIFGYYHVQVLVADPQTGDWIVRHASGEQAALVMQHGNRIRPGEGIIGYVAELAQPFVTNDVEAVVSFLRNPLLPDTRSELTVPIKIDGKVVGVLDIQEKAPIQFAQRQMNLMMTVADQLSVALQKANLYQELQTSLQQEKEMRAQLLQSDRLALVGKLLASVSHELNNPLQAIQNALFLIKNDEHLSKQGQQDLQIVLSETERMASLIGRLRAAYRATQTEEYQAISLNDLIRDVHALTATSMRHANVRFAFHPDPALPLVPVIEDKIRQVILNLFMNAIEAMPGGGEFTVHTQYLPEQEQVLLTFADTGPGIHPEIYSRIFEPFVTNKENGTGLGLTISADIVHQHGGQIQAENNSTGGATFKIWLPIEREK